MCAQVPSCAAQGRTHLIQHRDKYHVVCGGRRGALQEKAVKIPVTRYGCVSHCSHLGGWPCRASSQLEGTASKAGRSKALA